MTNELQMKLEKRFVDVSRGRDVAVRIELEDFILALDYLVHYEESSRKFVVVLRRGGCFEGAYRCVERFIEASAEQLDGVHSCPSEYVDLRLDMGYWRRERVFEQFFFDLSAAINEYISGMNSGQPNGGVHDELPDDIRSRMLLSMLAYLQSAATDVRRAILSPETILILKAINFDVPLKPI